MCQLASHHQSFKSLQLYCPPLIWLCSSVLRNGFSSRSGRNFKVRDSLSGLDVKLKKSEMDGLQKAVATLLKAHDGVDDIELAIAFIRFFLRSLTKFTDAVLTEVSEV